MVLMPQCFFPLLILGTPIVGRRQGAIKLDFHLLMHARVIDRPVPNH